MKKRDFLHFRDMMHSNKDLFEMPAINISDTQFQTMINRAKVESSSVQSFSIADFTSSFYPFKVVLFSPMLAAVLIFAIITITVGSFSRASTDTYLAQNSPNVLVVDKNTRLPIDEGILENID